MNAGKPMNGDSVDAQQTKSQLIELLKKNAKAKSVLNSLNQLQPNGLADFDLSKSDLSKLDLDKLDLGRWFDPKKPNKLNTVDFKANPRRERRGRKEESLDQPKCFELNTSTICFTNID